ncbi:TIGR04222 domain-containing membrane protein, partial [Streptomyces triticirhizae]
MWLALSTGPGLLALAILVWAGSLRSRALPSTPALAKLGVGTVAEAAFLAGGPERVADTVLVALWEKERVTIEDRWVRVVRPVADDPLERAALGVLGEEWGAPLDRVRAELIGSPLVRDIGEGLASRGLTYLPRQRRAWGRAIVLCRLIAGFALLSAPFSLVALSLGEPARTVWTLLGPALGLVALIGSFVLAPPSSSLPPLGRETMRQLRAHRPRLVDSLAGAVALGGVAVLGAELVEQFRGAILAAATAPAASATSPSWGAGCGAAGGCGGDGGSGGGGCGGGSGGCGG